MEKKRENPYKSKGRPTVIGLAKHKAEIALKDNEIEELKSQIWKQAEELSETRNKIGLKEIELEEAFKAVKALDDSLTQKSGQVLRLRGELEKADKEATAAREYIKCLLK